MLKFCTSADAPLFCYVAKVVIELEDLESVLNNEIKPNEFKCTTLFTQNESFVDKYMNKLGLFCFPHPKNMLTKGETDSFIFTNCDAEKNYTFCYVYSLYHQAYVLVSEYYHPDVLLELVEMIGKTDQENPQNTVSLIQKLHQIRFQKGHEVWTVRCPDKITLVNKDMVSPSNELCKLIKFVFSRLSITNILYILAAIIVECPIVVLSSQNNIISKTCLGILALLYPLEWTGSFIPVLPSPLLETLGAPFAYIIGLNTCYGTSLLSETISQYFILNPDARYVGTISMEDFPSTINQEIDKMTIIIKSIFKDFAPFFPFSQITKKLHRFIRNIISHALKCDGKNSSSILDAFFANKYSQGDDFDSLITQTQFLNHLIFQIQDGKADVIHSFWPKETIIKREIPLSLRRQLAQPMQRQVKHALKTKQSKSISLNHSILNTSYEIEKFETLNEEQQTVFSQFSEETNLNQNVSNENNEKGSENKNESGNENKNESGNEKSKHKHKKHKNKKEKKKEKNE